MISKNLVNITRSILLTLLGLTIIYLAYQLAKTQISERKIFYSTQNTQQTDISKISTTPIIGIWDCLPSDFSDDRNLDCAMGVKTISGNYYLLIDFNKHFPKTIKRGVVFLSGKPLNTIKSKSGILINHFLVTGR